MPCAVQVTKRMELGRAMSVSIRNYTVSGNWLSTVVLYSGKEQEKNLPCREGTFYTSMVCTGMFKVRQWCTGIF